MAENPTLTRKQQEVYEHLRDTHYDPPPTLDELCGALGLSSRGSLHKHIKALIKADLVVPMAGKQRGVRLTEAARLSAPAGAEAACLPLLGYIAAGHPIEAVEVPEEIEVPQALRGRRDCYVLKVRGDSMFEDGILDGDWVVIEQRERADNGEVVVALVDGNEATLKRLQRKGRKVILHPANSSMKPMEFSADRVAIQGVLVGQMRSYR